MELTDTHCHIYLPEFDTDRDEAVRRAIDSGVTRLFLPNVDRSTAGPLLNLAGRYPDHCFPMMGLHPTSVNEGYREELAAARDMLQNHRFCGIGEIGIDLYWDKSFRAQQEEALLIQLGWAVEMKLPVVIHVRESHAETITVIRGSGLTGLTGIFHCFTGTADQALEIISMGFHLGIGGVSTFKNSTLGDVLPQINPEHIVLETDSPYLAPVPWRGKRNEPAFIMNTLLRLATIYNMHPSDLAALTTATSRKIFGI